MASGELERVASTLVADGKGILAADETVPTLTRRFDTLAIKSTEQSRRTYREGSLDRPAPRSYAGRGRFGRPPNTHPGHAKPPAPDPEAPGRRRN